MENIGKHEYMESMNVKTWMFFRFGKKKAYTHGQKKKNRPTDPEFFSLRYGKQTYFLMPYVLWVDGNDLVTVFWQNLHSVLAR